DGERNEGTGCVLEAVPGERFSWTNLMGPGFAPNELGEGDFGFTATISFEAVADGTRYSATVRHVDEAGMRAHEQMGFHDGWNAALDQLVELFRNLRG
ncbi:MAG: SRPBCC domain-containing protein, partial [Actinomycetes bacterium]